MKTNTKSSVPILRNIVSGISLFVSLFIGLLAVTTVSAAEIDKANNTANLNLTTSWVQNVLPGTNDVATWNATVTSANATSLGASTQWQGIRVTSPGGPVQIDADGNTLTNGNVNVVGNVGIDMSTAAQSLTLSNNVVLSGVQNWNLGSGQALTFGGSLGRNAGGVARIYSPSLNVTLTNGSAVISTNTSPNVMLGSTYGNIFFATINDLDFAAVQSVPSGFQIISGLGTGMYTQNPVAATPTDPGNVQIMDFVNNTWGDRLGNSRVYSAIRFNSPQVGNLVNGIPTWQITGSGARTFQIGAILITTNVGACNVGIATGGGIELSTGGAQDTLIYQNNPQGDLIFGATGGNFSGGGALFQGAGAGTASSLIKMGVGRLIIQGGNSTYTGGTRIYEGTILISAGGTVGSAPLNVFGGTFAAANGTSNNAPTTIFSGATNKIVLNAANGTASDNSNLTLLAGTRFQVAYSNSVAPSATAPVLVITNMSNGLLVSNTVTVDVLCGNLSLGQFPLIKYSGTIGGDGGNAFVLGVIEPHSQGYISNNVGNSSIDLVVTNITQPISWGAGTGTWDIGSTASWKDTLANPTTYLQNAAGGDNVIFDDSATGTGPFTVTLNQTPSPSSVTFNNSAKTYTLAGNGGIIGIGGVSMIGSGTLFLQTTNFFAGGLNLNNGLVNFVTLSNLGAGPINFNGGTLQFAPGNSNDISVDTVNFNAGVATLDVNGNTVAFAHPVGNGGTGGLTLTNGTLQINGTNRYSGNTLVNSGSTLAFQSPNTYISNSPTLVVKGTLDTSPGINANTFSLVLNGAANQQIVGTGTVMGAISTSSGTTISPATNGVTGTLTVAGDLTVNGGTIAMDINGPTGATKDALAITTGGGGTGSLTLNGGLNSGTLVLNVGGTLNNGVYPLITYQGSLVGSVGNLVLSGFSQPGALGYLSASSPNNGTISLNVIPGATNSLTWGGQVNNVWDNNSTANWVSNGVSGQIFQNGDKVTFDDTGLLATVALGDAGVSSSGILLPGAVQINATNNNYTFQDGVGDGSGEWIGPMSLTINSSAANVTTVLTPNGYGGPTTVNGGTLQIGNGGVTGDIGVGNITNNGTVVFDQPDNRSVLGQISGSGNLVQEGSADLILLTNNIYTGKTIISNANSTLQVGTGGAVGTLGTGAVTNNGTLFIDRSGSFTLNNGVSGSGSVTFGGGAAYTLSGTLAWQGNTSLTNGSSIKLAAANQIPNTNTVAGSTGNLGLSGRLDLNGFNQMVNGLTDLGATNGIITNSAASGTNVLTIGLNSASNSLLYSGRIVDVTNRSAIQLVINNPGTVQLAAANTYRGGTFVGGGATLNLGTAGSAGIPGNTAAGTGSITLSNGTTLFMNGNAITLPANPVTIVAGATVSFNAQALGNQYSGLISGPANSTNIIAGPWTAGGTGTDYNGFLGTVLVPNGGTLRFFNTPNGGTNTTFDLEGTGVIQTRTTEFAYLGTLIGNASYGFNATATFVGAGITGPNAGGTGNFVLGSANTSSTYRGTITGANNIFKNGTGTVSLVGSSNVYTIDSVSGATNYFMTNGLAYVGSTTVSNGVLAIIAPANLNGTNFTSFTLASNAAVLDLSSAGSSPDGLTLVTNSMLNLGSGQSLTGLGTIRGSVVASNGSTVSVAMASNTNGSPTTGVLNITNSVELGGAVNININVTNTPNCGEIVSPTITVDPSATLVVTNLGPQNGATFQLFSSAVNFASVTLPTLTGTNAWVNNLSVNGSITLLAPPLVTGPTTNAQITGASLSGTNLIVVGTNNNVPNTSFHYVVLTSTNISTPLSNWTPVVTNPFNGNGTFNYTNPIVPGIPRQFIEVQAVP
jgi:autotransporter-associated beta strand protein